MKTNPLSLVRLFSETDELLDTWTSWRSRSLGYAGSYRASYDSDSAKFEVFVPGYNKDEIEVASLDGGTSIHVIAKNEKLGGYSTKLSLNSIAPSYDGNKASVKLENGVLYIDVPVRESSKARKLLIQ